MKMDLKKIMRIIAEKQLSEIEEDENEMENDDDDKLEKMKRTRPKMKSKEMQELVDKKRKAIILLMMKNKRA